MDDGVKSAPDRPGARFHELAGVPNFRDVGGYEAADGRRVKWRCLFRSAAFARAEAADLALLDDLNVRVVCDLRAERERRQRVSRWPVGSMPRTWCRPDASSVGNIVDAILAPGASPATVRDTMIATYRKIPFAQAESFRDVMGILVAGEFPAVIHCSVGKDRTGALVAIILDLLGVDRADILDDYLLSRQAFEPLCEFIMAGPSGQTFGHVDKSVWAPMVSVERAYLDAMFAALDESHGSVENYAKARLGMTPHDIVRLREALLC